MQDDGAWSFAGGACCCDGGESLSGRVRVRLFRCQAKRGGVEVCTSVGRPADTHAWLAASCFVVRNDSRERS